MDLRGKREKRRFPFEYLFFSSLAALSSEPRDGPRTTDGRILVSSSSFSLFFRFLRPSALRNSAKGLENKAHLKMYFGEGKISSYAFNPEEIVNCVSVWNRVTGLKISAPFLLFRFAHLCRRLFPSRDTSICEG